MKFLLTGATGFLGRHIREALGENCLTLARKNADIPCDLSRDVLSLPEVDVVIHAAGKAHVVPRSKQEEEAFYEVNVAGTANLLKSLELSGKLPHSFVFISSVSVYGLDVGNNLTEETPLHARDAYGKSKILAEDMLKTWCAANEVVLTIFRLPLIAGKNPPGNLGAMIDGIKKGYYVNIDHGNARKSIVLATDVASVIKNYHAIGGVYNLTDGRHPSFRDLSGFIAGKLNKNRPLSIPRWLARTLGLIGDFMGNSAPLNTAKLKKITQDLTFNDDKARIALNWNPRSVLEDLLI